MGGIFQGHTTLSFVLDDEAKRACSVTAGHTVATAFTISLLNGLGDNEKLYVSLIFIAFLFTPLSFDLRVSLSLPHHRHHNTSSFNYLPKVLK